MKELTKIEKAPSELMQSAMTADAVVGQVALVKEIMTKVMVKDEDVCVHCGLCAERCPTAAWDMQKFDLKIPYAGRPKGETL